MSSFALPVAISAHLTRSVAIAALLGATMLAGPLSAARAAPATSAPVQLAQAVPQTAAVPHSKAAAGAAEMKAETVEQRITSLHASLEIAPNEESDWKGVAQAMRDNAAAIEKLVAERTAQSPQGMTAVEDLQAYQKFAQAHVDGLKNLISAFDTLYNSMPDAQKKVADQVFQGPHHQHSAAHS
jgi:hypothetical protein